MTFFFCFFNNFTVSICLCDDCKRTDGGLLWQSLSSRAHSVCSSICNLAFMFYWIGATSVRTNKLSLEFELFLVFAFSFWLFFFYFCAVINFFIKFFFGFFVGYVRQLDSFRANLMKTVVQKCARKRKNHFKQLKKIMQIE